MIKMSKKEAVERYHSLAKDNMADNLDVEEKEMLTEWQNIQEQDIETLDAKTRQQLLKELKEAQANYRREHPSYKSAQKKDKGLYIRINSDDLEKFKQEALRQGLSYQTYLTFLISQVNNHRLNIKAEFTKKTGTDDK